MRLILWLPLLLFACGAAVAQSSCPWLTSGTAAAALGGPVQLVYKPVSAGEGSCRFTAVQGQAAGVLEVEVSMASLQQCPASSAVVSSLGTAAVRCTRTEPPGALHFLVEGRVRNTSFRVTLRPATTPVTPQNNLKPEDVTQRVAEQVVGNLF